MTVIAGRYALETEIGRGGMGAVWRGRDEVLGRTVALKRIGMAPGGITPDALRAEREAKLAAKLNHANVVAVFDLVDEALDDGQSQQWLVMEYVDGTDLAALIQQRGRLTPGEAAPILAQAAAALAAAHGAGIVHRDVKPSNILVAPDGQVKLSDFGIARTSGDPALTQTGLVTGSPAYLSPEVASGHQATPASDVWSWGATLFHALEGSPPYQVGDNLLGALYRIVNEEPPHAGTAGWLSPALAGTMNRDPAQRWPILRAQEFLQGGPATEPLVTAPAGEAHATAYEERRGTRLLPTPVRPPRQPPPSTPVAPPRAAPPTPPMPPPAGRRLRRRRGWPLVVVAVAAVVVATLVAFAIGMHETGSGGGGSAGPATSSSGSSGSPSGSTSDQPTEDGMTSFIHDYIATAASDPKKAFTMLTPDFQKESGGLAGYEGFWGSVDSAEILSVSADPDQLVVQYRYRYQRDGKATVDSTTLDLTYHDGSYLIAGEH